MTHLAPILLFVYNRPRHTRKILNALRKNELANESTLYIYADGPKRNADEETLKNIKKTRTLIRDRKWCREVHIIERNDNNGLANSIVYGVSEVLKVHEKVIVLEDDIITSPGFLKYMNDALSLYADQKKVMHISGYMYPVNHPLPQTFFFTVASCWGWGTWKRAWDLYISDPNIIDRFLKENQLYANFDIEGAGDYVHQVRANCSGSLNTWAVKWYGSVYLNKGLCLHPYPSLTQNIGNDGSGIHSANSRKYNWKNLAKKIEPQRIPIRESLEARDAVRQFLITDERDYLPHRFILYSLRIKNGIIQMFISKKYRQLQLSKIKRIFH